MMHLYGFIPPDDPPEDDKRPRCRCGKVVDLEPSPHFVTYCSASCMPAPAPGPLRTFVPHFREKAT